MKEDFSEGKKKKLKKLKKLEKIHQLVFSFFFLFGLFQTEQQNKSTGWRKKEMKNWVAEHLESTTKADHQVEGGLLLDVVIGKSAAVLKLLASEDETLLIGGDALLVLDLGLDVVDGVRGLDFESNGLASQGLDEDLHATAKTEDEVKSGLLLNVVVREGAAVLELLAGKDKTLLIGRNAFLVLDLGLDVVDGVRGLNLKSNGLASQGLDENLHD